MRPEDDVIEIDFFELLLEIRKKMIAILAAAFALAAVVGIYSFAIAEPVYEATSKLYIQAQDSATTTLSELQMGSTLAHDCVEMIQSRSIAQDVTENLNLDIEVHTLQKRLKVTNPEDTRIINITVHGTDPEQITQIANEFAAVSSTRISEIMRTNKPQIWENAAVPDNPVKPEKGKNIILGFLSGLVLSIMAVVALYIMNDTIKSQEEIERYLNMTVLTVVPLSGDERKKKKHRFGRKNRTMAASKRDFGQQTQNKYSTGNVTGRRNRNAK